MFNEDTYETVMCRICGFSCAHLSSHLRSKHNIDSKQYKREYGGPIVCRQRTDMFTKSNPAKTDKFKQAHSARMSGKGNPNFGKPQTKDHRRKISDGLRGHKHPMYGKKHSEETKKRMSIANTGKLNPMYGKSAWTGKRHNEEIKRKISIGRAKYLSNNSYSLKRTKIEVLCADMLSNMGISFIEQYRVDEFVYDFYLDTYSLFIEVQGDYWHANPTKYDYSSLQHTQLKNVERDRMKQEKVGAGNVLYLWEHDITIRPEVCRELISKFVSGECDTYNSYDMEER